MLRPVADFVMKSRLTACLAAMAASFVPIIGLSIIALVTLRKGALEGAFVLLWSLLPVAVRYLLEYDPPVFALLSTAACAAAFLSAWMLRASQSWSYALASIVGLSLVFDTAVMLQRDFVAGQIELINGQLSMNASGSIETVSPPDAQSEEQASPDRQIELGPNFRDEQTQTESQEFAFTPQLLSASLIAGTAFVALLGLLLARHWQASLYNPGGFRQEFHGLRLDQSVVIGLALLMVLASLAPESSYLVVVAVSIPFVIAGLGFVHCLVTSKNLGWFVLALVYVGFLISPIWVILGLIGATDPWLDYRKRFILVQ